MNQPDNLNGQAIIIALQINMYFCHHNTKGKCTLNILLYICNSSYKH